MLCNDYPTGVEVSQAMPHGGPAPATSNSRTTSVSASAIDRFLRPANRVMPAYLLQAAIQDNNPPRLWRVRDGELVNS